MTIAWEGMSIWQKCWFQLGLVVVCRVGNRLANVVKTDLIGLKFAITQVRGALCHCAEASCIIWDYFFLKLKERKIIGGWELFEL